MYHLWHLLHTDQPNETQSDMIFELEMKGEKNLEYPGEEGSHPLHVSPIPSWREDSERSNSLILLCVLF